MSCSRTPVSDSLTVVVTVNEHQIVRLLDLVFLKPKCCLTWAYAFTYRDCMSLTLWTLLFDSLDVSDDVSVSADDHSLGL
jgi:hypothetical protein